jgi:hypothetical protein
MNADCFAEINYVSAKLGLLFRCILKIIGIYQKAVFLMEYRLFV